jgi:hypothetical protein
MTTTSSRAMTPQEYRRWWEYDATDQEVADAPHPDDYATAYQRMQQREQARRSAAQPPRREDKRERVADDTKDAERKAPPARKARPRFHWDRFVPASFGLLILGLWWLAGARWTIDGAPLLLNVFLDFLRFPADWRFAPVTTFAPYLWFCWLPIGISIVEHVYAPWRNSRRSGILVLLFLVLIWFIVTSGDWSSTYLALKHPQPGAWPLTLQIASSPLLAGVLTTLTTFVPEIGISVLLWWLREP